jgi:hypothetical protein
MNNPDNGRVVYVTILGKHRLVSKFLDGPLDILEPRKSLPYSLEFEPHLLRCNDAAMVERDGQRIVWIHAKDEADLGGLRADDLLSGKGAVIQGNIEGNHRKPDGCYINEFLPSGYGRFRFAGLPCLPGFSRWRGWFPPGRLRRRRY